VHNLKTFNLGYIIGAHMTVYGDQARNFHWNLISVLL